LLLVLLSAFVQPAYYSKVMLPVMLFRLSTPYFLEPLNCLQS